MSVDRFPVKRPHWRNPPWINPSGALILPTGRRSIQCESGFHKWDTQVVFNVPMMRCNRCGYRMPRPILYKTEKRRRLIENVQKQMDKDKPTVPPRKPGDEKAEDVYDKAFGELVVKLWERHQNEYELNRARTKYIKKKVLDKR